MNKRRVFVVSDTHFNHANIIKYQDRPFNSVEEMNEALVKNWNERVGKNDFVIHLGDFGMPNSVPTFLPRLNGRVFLLKGNHDNFGKARAKEWGLIGFQKTITLLEFTKMFGLDSSYVREDITFSHYPTTETTSDFLYHGHTHSHQMVYASEDGINRVNFSVEATGYKPVLLDFFEER